VSAGLAGVRAGFEKNKKPLAILGALVVAGLAVIARRKSAMGSTTSSGSSSATPATSSGYTAATIQPAAYDSTGTDVYNALQPQIEQLQQLARQIPVAGAGTASSGVQEYVRKTGDTRVYAAMSDGSLKTIDHADWAAAGSPSYADLPTSDPVWSRPATASTGA
jgi:hypothetical protein